MFFSNLSSSMILWFCVWRILKLKCHSLFLYRLHCILQSHSGVCGEISRGMRTCSTSPGISCGGLLFGDPFSILLGGKACASWQERLLWMVSLHLPASIPVLQLGKPPGQNPCLVWGGGSPRTPQDFARSLCSPCHSWAGALLSWAPFPLLPLPHHPNFAASGLNSAHYHRRTHRGCQAAPECKKSMQSSLLIKGCPVGSGPADPGWLSPWFSLNCCLRPCPPCRGRHLGWSMYKANHSTG